jgi:GTP-binding protein HflX
MIEETKEPMERAILVAVKLPNHRRFEIEDYLLELRMLAETAGADVVESFIQEKDAIDSKTFVGKGKADELKQYASANDVDTVIFDDELSPAQLKVLEKMLCVKVLDRSNVILDIFARHARTREAKTQVELAQLHYVLPRLTRMWTHLSRQKGGGVGLRGPGETQLETDKRLIQKRISLLNDELKHISQQNQTRKKNRADSFKLALIGYTNVGKSTIMNALTHAEVLVENKLFATLDSTIRKIYLNKEHQVLLSDTVGFIRKLPHQLVASFKSTLEEVLDADLLLHVVDVSSPVYMEQIKTVNNVLKELGAEEKDQLIIFNKVDKVENDGVITNAKLNFPNSIFVSALKKIRLERIREEVLAYIEAQFFEQEYRLTYREAPLVNTLHSVARVTSEQYEDNEIIIQCKISKENFDRIEKRREALAFMDE